jgi:6-phosphogluconolactonase (cycloisomerase 2 family)
VWRRHAAQPGTDALRRPPLLANQHADRISIFARDAATGRLTDTGRSIDIGTPMCVKIVR